MGHRSWALRLERGAGCGVRGESGLAGMGTHSPGLGARSGPHSCSWGPCLASIAGLVRLAGAAAPGAAGARSGVQLPSPGRSGSRAGGGPGCWLRK